jgi:hypothetical protein
MNPKLMIFLPTLEVKNSSITWKHKPGTSFGSVIVHEFLHLYGDTPELRPGVVDGVIRHTNVGTSNKKSYRRFLVMIIQLNAHH